MKYLIASDLHGSFACVQKLIDRFTAEQADKLILLGDLYYHGPRNPLPQEYNVLQVAELLNKLKDRIVVIKGNCDSEVDEMISEFEFLPVFTLKQGKKIIIFTHGHRLNQNLPPKSKFDVLIYGHEHTGYIKRQDNKLFINVGSVSLPKGGTPKSYLILCGTKVELKNLDGQIIDQVEI